MPTPLPDQRLAPVVDELLSRSDGEYSAEFLRDLVTDIAIEFEDARVQDYFEVLVAKEARDRLRHPVTS